MSDDQEMEDGVDNSLIKEDGGEDDGNSNEEEEQSEAGGGQGSPEKDENDGSSRMRLGGLRDKPCFALLDGVVEDPETNTLTRVTIPITRLPAILGRTHDTDDPHFFGLGKKKALSRKQCLIEYRAGKDGEARVEWDDQKQKLVYKTKENPDSESGQMDTQDLPETGYFAIGSMGKNRIMVNQERIAQGKVALLESGTPIRISSYMLYFLLPMDSTPEVHPVPDTNNEDNDNDNSNKSPAKKRKPVPDSATSAGDNKKAKTTMGASFQAELDAMSVDDLLERMTHAINNNEWERRHQLIGSTIALHAVRAAAMDPNIQATAAKVGVSRSAIMTWIEKSHKYKEWVEQMLTKMEPRSYQAAVTKSLLKAGFTRTGSSGRYIKWVLPKDIPIVKQEGRGNEQDNEQEKEDGSGDEDEDEGDDEEGDEDDEAGGEDEGNDDKDGDENGARDHNDNNNNDQEAEENESRPGGDDEDQGSASELEKTGGTTGTVDDDNDEEDD